MDCKSCHAAGVNLLKNSPAGLARHLQLLDRVNVPSIYNLLVSMQALATARFHLPDIEPRGNWRSAWHEFESRFLSAPVCGKHRRTSRFSSRWLATFVRGTAPFPTRRG